MQAVVKLCGHLLQVIVKPTAGNIYREKLPTAALMLLSRLSKGNDLFDI